MACYTVCRARHTGTLDLKNTTKKEAGEIKELRIAMIRSGVTYQDLSKAVGLSVTSLRNRIAGRTGWQLPEAIRVKNYLTEQLGTPQDIDELFELSTRHNKAQE